MEIKLNDRVVMKHHNHQDSSTIPLGSTGICIGFDGSYVFVDWDEDTNFTSGYEHQSEIEDDDGELVWFDNVWCVHKVDLEWIESTTVLESPIIRKIKQLDAKHQTKQLKLRKVKSVFEKQKDKVKEPTQVVFDRLVNSTGNGSSTAHQIMFDGVTMGRVSDYWVIRA